MANRGICRACGCSYLDPCPAGCAWSDETQTHCTACTCARCEYRFESRTDYELGEGGELVCRDDAGCRLRAAAKPAIRELPEIQRAHDVLVAIVTGEVEIEGLEDESDQAMLHAALDVLCWVLHHAHNRKFGEILQSIEMLARANGYELVDSGKASVRPIEHRGGSHG